MKVSVSDPDCPWLFETGAKIHDELYWNHEDGRRHIRSIYQIGDDHRLFLPQEQGRKENVADWRSAHEPLYLVNKDAR